MTNNLIDPQLLHSLEEDDRSVPESPILPSGKNNENEKGKEIQSPVRCVTAPTSPLPVSANPITNSNFVSPRNDEKANCLLTKVI